MSVDSIPSMHPDFPRWYRTVDIEENRERLHRRWRGVASLVAAAKRGDVETMIRIAFRSRPAPSADSLARVRQFFRDADEYFDAQDNARELEVLCGSSLALLMQQGRGLAARSALAVTTSAFGGAGPLDLPMDLPSLAEQAIVVLSENGRKRPDPTNFGIGDEVKSGFDKAAAEVLQQSDSEGLAAAFGLAAEAAHNGLQRIERLIAMQDEELQILWWLFGGHSTDFDRAFKDLPPEAQPLVLAKELADATQFPPGPSSAKAILSRAGLKERAEMTVSEAVSASDPAWLTKLSKRDEISPVSEPLHFAIQRRIEAGADTAWIAGWASATGIDQELKLSALTLGNLFYRERLLALPSEE